MNSTEIILEIIANIYSIEDLQKFFSSNKRIYNIYKHYYNYKTMLKNLQVDYTDPTNFIYIAPKDLMLSFFFLL